MAMANIILNLKGDYMIKIIIMVLSHNPVDLLR